MKTVVKKNSVILASLIHLTIFVVTALNVVHAASIKKVNSCDKLAAHPFDLMAITEGTEWNDIDIQKALPACKSAVREMPNSARLQYQLGRVLAKSGNDKEALSHYLSAANKNYTIAQYNTGVLYADGSKNIQQNNIEAVKWFQMAASQGLNVAQTYLGFMYFNGLGIQQNYFEAEKWYRKAAEQGDEVGQNNLGDLYLTGKGIQQNYIEAEKWFRKAAAQGQPHAQHSLGHMYYKGRGVDKNYHEAEKWFRKAAENNFRDAEHWANESKKLANRGPCQMENESKITTCVVSQGLCDSNGCGNFTRCESKETYLYGESCVRELNMKATMYGSYYCHIETLAFSKNIDDIFDYMCK